MKQLTLEHLCGYLPWGLKITNCEIPMNARMCDLLSTGKYEQRKPILRPLSQLTEEIEHNGERFVPIEWISKNFHNLEFDDGLFSDETCSLFSVEWLPYKVIQKLYEWHFDIHGLKELGLAISYKESYK